MFEKPTVLAVLSQPDIRCLKGTMDLERPYTIEGYRGPSDTESIEGSLNRSDGKYAAVIVPNDDPNALRAIKGSPVTPVIYEIIWLDAVPTNGHSRITLDMGPYEADEMLRGILGAF